MPIPGMTGGDQVPIVKFNAKSRLWKVDDVTVDKIDMIIDLGGTETGWMRFTENSAPDFRMVKVADLLNGAEYPAEPADSNGLYRKGFRVKVKISDKLAAGSPSVREFASSSLATKGAFNKLWNLWQAAQQHQPGKVPVVRCNSYEEIPGRHGSNYAPVLTIVRWVDRPADLVDGPASTAKAAKPTSPPPHVTEAAGEPEVIDDADGPENFADLEDEIPF
jgi:hypothetical protein